MFYYYILGKSHEKLKCSMRKFDMFLSSFLQFWDMCENRMKKKDEKEYTNNVAGLKYSLSDSHIQLYVF
jgi:hypothetical protein